MVWPNFFCTCTIMQHWNCLPPQGGTLWTYHSKWDWEPHLILRKLLCQKSQMNILSMHSNVAHNAMGRNNKIYTFWQHYPSIVETAFRWGQVARRSTSLYFILVWVSSSGLCFYKVMAQTMYFIAFNHSKCFLIPKCPRTTK